MNRSAKDKADALAIWILPLIHRAWKSLRPGGVCAMYLKEDYGDRMQKSMTHVYKDQAKPLPTLCIRNPNSPLNDHIYIWRKVAPA